MATTLTTDQLPAFRAWFARRRPIGLGLSDTQLAVGDSTGDSWLLETGPQNRALLLSALAALRASTRKVWAVGATDVTIDLARRFAIDLEGLTWLLDARTARSVLCPGVEFVEANQGASRNAVATARLMEKLMKTSIPMTRRAVMNSAQQEVLWRRAQQRGWLVDVQMLNEEYPKARAKHDADIRKHGLNLAGYTDEAKVEIHAWLSKHGIFIADPLGQPSLDRKYDKRAVIPDTEAGRAIWAEYKSVRSNAGRLAKLNEFRYALHNGRIHSTINVYGARTGRTTVTKPALQNITATLRPLLRADPGYVLVALDYSQMEPRIAAALSGDTAMIAALEAGDVYAGLARSIWGADADDADGVILPERRAIAKTCFIAVLYGYGAATLALDLDSTVPEAKKLIDSVWAAYPQLTDYVSGLKAAHHRGETAYTISGRPLPLPTKGDYQLLNYQVQATGADILYQAVARIVTVLGVEVLYLSIHDELVLHVKAGQSEFAKSILEREMTTVLDGVTIGGAACTLGVAWRKPD